MGKSWNITITHGIPYNTTGQAIVERAHRTLKESLNRIIEKKTHVPLDQQDTVLMKALYLWNQFDRHGTDCTPMRKNYNLPMTDIKAKVLVRFPETDTWLPGWSLVVFGRGYTAVSHPEEPEVRWVPAKCIKPDLNCDNNA